MRFSYWLRAITVLSPLLAACSGADAARSAELGPPAGVPSQPDGPLPANPQPANTPQPSSHRPPAESPFEWPIDATVVTPNLVVITDWSSHLGADYDTTTHAFVDHCMAGGAIPFDQTLVTLESYQSATEDTAHELLSLSDGPIVFADTVPFARDDARVAAFAKQAGADATSMSDLAAIRADIGGVTLDGNEVPTNEPGCDLSSFIDQVQYGVRFVYGLKLQFRDADARYDFGRQHAFGPVDALKTGDRTALARELNGQATIQLQVFALGGSADGGASLQALVNGSKCSIAGLTDCVDTLHALESYASSVVPSTSSRSADGTPGAGWVPYVAFAGPAIH